MYRGVGRRQIGAGAATEAEAEAEAEAAWKYGGHFRNEWPQHPYYEPVPVPRDGTGVMVRKHETTS